MQDAGFGSRFPTMTMTAKTTAKPAVRRPAGAKDDLYWQAVLARDRSFDGTFCYSVASTGVYCRPSCPARRPKRANIAFHASPAAAEAAGFRPCRRCRPDAAALYAEHAAKVVAACRSIETAEEPPTLAALARAAGLSPYHFHRIFKAATGVTPKAYAAAHRRRRLPASLKRSPTVTDALFEAGYGSAARFYADAPKALGMTPSAFRAGGAGRALTFAVSRCTLGNVLVAASDTGIAAILLGDDAETLKRELEDRFPGATLIAGDRAFEAVVQKAVRLIEAPAAGLDLPLDVQGTAFQQRVWQALRDIPPGTTATYADIARRIGHPRAVRAVAAACAANPVAVAIPCHRVVRRDGALAGYRWGLARKRALIARETGSEND